MDLDALPGVPEAVAAARAAIASARRMPGNRRDWPRTAAAAGIRAARVSAVLDGGSGAIIYDGVRDDSRPETPQPDPADAVVTDPVLAGALRANAAVGDLASVWQRAPLQALARLHALAAADLAESEALGRPRGVPGVPDRLAALAGVVAAQPWSAPVMVAVVHGELLTLAPFGTANGVVARAAARLTMVTTGLDPQALTVPEVGYLRARQGYRSAAASFAEGRPESVAAWIVLVCTALQAGAREAKSIATAAAGGLTPELKHATVPDYLGR